MKLRRLLPWAILLALAAYAVGVEPRWVRANQPEMPTRVANRWGPDRDLRIAVAADWHIGKHWFRHVMTAERAREIVQAINAARPHIVLLPGDFVASDMDDPSRTASAPEIAAVLGELRAPLGVYAVLGNHDWWQDGPGMAQALRAKGITVLENDAIQVPGTTLWVAGIGDDFTGHAQPQQAMAKVPRDGPVLVLMHDPAPFRELPRVNGLVVAGHTHGGQVALPFYGALTIPTAAPREWAYGWVAHGDNQMYVTSGLGVSILPLRFFMRPEWALITIREK